MVMSQAFVISGADIAIVDLNSRFVGLLAWNGDVAHTATIEDEAARQATQLVETFKEENPGAKR